MINLTPITTDPVDRFRSIANDKQNRAGNNRRDRIQSLVQPVIIPRYLFYEQHFRLNTIESIPKVIYSVEDKDDLLHCYTSETASLSKLISDIKDNQLLHIRGICQFCGINTDDTTDHYLPKGQYPEYCVNPLNLFPCCPTCNSLKGEYMWDDAYKTRGILNFYKDQIPNSQYLFANITYNGVVPLVSFDILNINGISAATFAIIDRHYNRLDLINRYKTKFNSVYYQTFSSFRNKYRFTGHPGRVKEFLLDDANQLFKDYGRNYYVAIIKEALAHSNTFINSF